MSSVACQGLQSCLEPWPKLTATRPYFTRSLSFTRRASFSESDSEKELKEKKENNYSTDDQQNNSSNYDIFENKKNQSSSSGGDMGGWSFIQALSNISEGPKPAEADEKEKLYIHPLLKRSSSKLSERSLEMCTENLGSETGSVINEDIIIHSSDSDTGNSPTRTERPKSSSSSAPSTMRQLTRVNSREFPPPLTTISWTSQVQVKTHREGGRLLMKTVRVPCSQAYFQAEREDGRLRLHLSTSYSQSFDPQSDSQFDSQVTALEEEEEEEEGEDCEEEDAEAEIEGEEKEEEEAEEEEYDDDFKNWSGGKNENNAIVGGEVEMGNYGRRRRRSRCNEGDGHRNKLLLIQEHPCWVAT